MQHLGKHALLELCRIIVSDHESSSVCWWNKQLQFYCSYAERCIPLAPASNVCPQCGVTGSLSPDPQSSMRIVVNLKGNL